MLSKNQIKWINSFKIKKYRQLHDGFIVEGTKLASELIHNHYPIHTVFATDNYIQSNKNLIAQVKAEIVPISDKALKKISTLKTPNEVLIIAKQKAPSLSDLNNSITLLLDDISDPGNLGTIIRIADWFGIEHVICSPNSVDLYNPKVIQSTMGSFVRVNVIYKNLLDVLNENSAIPSFATTLDGKTLTDPSAHKAALIILGNESNGVSKAIQQKVDHKIKIAGKGHAESLNVAVAAGIICNVFCN